MTEIVRSLESTSGTMSGETGLRTSVNRNTSPRDHNGTVVVLPQSSVGCRSVTRSCARV